MSLFIVPCFKNCDNLVVCSYGYSYDLLFLYLFSLATLLKIPKVHTHTYTLPLSLWVYGYDLTVINLGALKISFVLLKANGHLATSLNSDNLLSQNYSSYKTTSKCLFVNKLHSSWVKLSENPFLEIILPSLKSFFIPVLYYIKFNCLISSGCTHLAQVGHRQNEYENKCDLKSKETIPFVFHITRNILNINSDWWS